MKFRTQLESIAYPEKISLADPILTIGSCFSNTIGDRFVENKMACYVNPFGTIYDPLSITRLLRMAIRDEQPGEATMVQSDGVWKNLLLHSSFSGLSQDELNLKIRARLSQVKKQLASAQWLMITFGTAFVYNFRENGQNVANCQKLPSAQFTKNLASNAALLEDFEGFLKELTSFNPDIKLILTVSPVRHIKDGLTENSVSKSILRVLCNSLSREYENIFYYPAYEIVVDDLRDYRFYKDDLIHPNSQATEYIWQHFVKSFFDPDLNGFLKEWSKLAAALQHRPFNPDSQEHQQFLKTLLADLEQLSFKVNLTREIAQVKAALLAEQ